MHTEKHFFSHSKSWELFVTNFCILSTRTLKLQYSQFGTKTNLISYLNKNALTTDLWGLTTNLWNSPVQESTHHWITYSTLKDLPTQCVWIFTNVATVLLLKNVYGLLSKDHIGVTGYVKRQFLIAPSYSF